MHIYIYIVQPGGRLRNAMIYTQNKCDFMAALKVIKINNNICDLRVSPNVRAETAQRSTVAANELPKRVINNIEIRVREENVLLYDNIFLTESSAFVVLCLHHDIYCTTITPTSFRYDTRVII